MAQGRTFRAIAVAALAVGLGACAPGRAHEALLVLADVAAGPGPSRLKDTRPVPNRRPITYAVEGRNRRGDLYLPGDGMATAAVVLVPGATRAGKDDPRLAAFAGTLARARVAALVPDMAGLSDFRLGPEHAGDVADAARHLGTVPETGELPLGFVAFSYAAGPAVVAAFEPDVTPRLRFLLLVGAYRDVEGALTFALTGHYRETAGGPWRHGRPNAWGKWMFARANASRLESAADRTTLIALAERKLDDPAADVADLVVLLGPEGRSVYALLANGDPDRVPALIAALPSPLRADIAALDLKGRDFGRLPGQLYLVHGRDDPLIPFSESATLAAAAPADRTHLYAVDNLAHVDLGPAGLMDLLVLWRAAYDLLSERAE